MRQNAMINHTNHDKADDDDDVSAEDDDQILARVNRWINEAVVGLNLCPFAVAEVQERRLKMVVAQESEIPQLMEFIRREIVQFANADALDLGTELIVAPNCEALRDFAEFHQLVTEIEEHVEDNDDLVDAVMVIGFHPRHEWGELASDSPLHFDRRAPYPLVNLLRAPQVDEYVSQGLTQHILAQNGKTLSRIGTPALRALYMFR